MFCPKCGNSMAEGSRFCNKCGHSAGAQSGSGNPFKPIGGPVPQQIPAAPQNYQQPVFPPVSQPAPPQRAHRFPVALTVILGSIVACLFLVLILVLVLPGRSSTGSVAVPEHQFTVAPSSAHTVPATQPPAAATEAPVLATPRPTPTQPSRPSNGNIYSIYFDDQDTYFCPASEIRYLNAQDLKYRNEDELNLMRNEIFARHGYIFQTGSLAEFFQCKSWYRPTVPAASFNSGVFSDVELANVNLITVYESILDGCYLSPESPFYHMFDGYSQTVLYDSSYRYYSEDELWNYDPDFLILARNEIFARHGYAFKDKELLAYFLNCDWYEPNIAPGCSLDMNQYERYNADLMLQVQEEMEAMGW